MGSVGIGSEGAVLMDIDAVGSAGGGGGGDVAALAAPPCCVAGGVRGMTAKSRSEGACGVAAEAVFFS
jgi:hypothetical protein